MNYKGHILISVILFFVLAFINQTLEIFDVSYLTYIFLFFVAIIYGLLPDIDTVDSKIGKLFLSICIIVILFCFLFSNRFLGIVVSLLMSFFIFIKHRGIVHTFLGAFLFSIPLISVGLHYVVFAFLFYSGHLIVDREFKLF